MKLCSIFVTFLKHQVLKAHFVVESFMGVRILGGKMKIRERPGIGVELLRLIRSHPEIVFGKGPSFCWESSEGIVLGSVKSVKPVTTIISSLS